MWVCKESQLALFRVDILPGVCTYDVVTMNINHTIPNKQKDRRWISIHNKNEVQLITEAELLNPSIIFGIVYHLPKHLKKKNLQSSFLKIFGMYSKLGFINAWELPKHTFNLGFDRNSSSTLVLPVCGVTHGLQFCFTNITDKPSFINNSVKTKQSNEDFGIIEVYGYSLHQIPTPTIGIQLLNIATFIQYKLLNYNNITSNEWNVCCYFCCVFLVFLL